MSKYSLDFKIQIVDQYLTGKDGAKTIADEHDVSVSMVKTWVALYCAQGLDGLTKKFSRYTAEFKLSVLELLWENKTSTKQLATAFNIRSPSKIGIWESKYREGGIDALRRRPPQGRSKMAVPTKLSPSPPAESKLTREEKLQAENDYLRMENAYLKKLQALVQSQRKTTPVKKRK